MAPDGLNGGSLDYPEWHGASCERRLETENKLQKAEIQRLTRAVLFFSRHYDGPPDNMLTAEERELFQVPELLRKAGGE